MTDTDDAELAAEIEADEAAALEAAIGAHDAPIEDDFGTPPLTAEEIANSDPEDPAFQTLDGQ